MSGEGCDEVRSEARGDVRGDVRRELDDVR